MKTRLINIFVDLFDLNDHVMEAEISINKIDEWDSLNHLNLIIAIENEFGINIPPDDFPYLYSDLNTIEIYVESKIE
ncbi:MAG: acyl carrier protein [Mariniphaga sp.]|nr:acyl carrier protein [Mariniphaga sp.]